MTSDRCLTLFRHTSMLCAALAFSLGTASAQISTPPDSSNSTVASSSESSSNFLQLDDAGMPGSAALPAAPSPDGSGGGQYDNKSHGGRWRRSHESFDLRGGRRIQCPDQRFLALHHVGLEFHGGRRLPLRQASRTQFGVPVHSQQVARSDHRPGRSNRRLRSHLVIHA